MRSKLFGLALTALIGVAWVSVSFAVEHPWDVDNRPGSSAPSIGVPGSNPRPGTDTTVIKVAAVGSSTGSIVPAANRQSYQSNWFQAVQWWLMQSLARFYGGSGDVE